MDGSPVAGCLQGRIEAQDAAPRLEQDCSRIDQAKTAA
jgi:hypothetical protein